MPTTIQLSAVGADAGDAVVRAAASVWESAGPVAVFAVVFVAVVATYIAAFVRRRHRVREYERVKARHPDEPWRWRPDWAAGKVTHIEHGGLAGPWKTALFWTVLSVPMAVVGILKAIEERNPLRWLVLIFPLVALRMLVSVVRATIRRRRYGGSTLTLATLPGTIGRQFSGTLTARVELPPTEKVRVVLSCIRRTRERAGDSRSTDEAVLWHDELRVQGRHLRRADGTVTEVPITFDIPADAPPCDDSNPYDRIVWRLEASASVSGVDYYSRFDVPIYQAAAASQPVPEAAPTAEEEAPYQRPADSPITVTPAASGTVIVFPPARNVRAALGLTAFWLVWGTVTVGLSRTDVPILIVVACGVVGLIMLIFVLRLWLHHSRVEVSPQRVVLTSGLVGLTHTQEVPAADIARVELGIGTQASGTPYYRIQLTGKGGQEYFAGAGIRDKREAEWLADRMADELGVEWREVIRRDGPDIQFGGAV